MRIVEVTLSTPTAENYRGATALGYHIAKYRSSGIELHIFTLNYNGVSAERIAAIADELNCTITVVRQPRWLAKAIGSLAVRMLMRYPVFHYITLPAATMAQIRALEPDGVWVNGEELGRIARQLSGYPMVHTLPDCESLYYRRSLELGGELGAVRRSQQLRNRVMRPKYERMERHLMGGSHVRYHLVGEADAAELRRINPGADARFIRHPHYDVQHPFKEIDFGGGRRKVRLLLAGQNNLYMARRAQLLIDALVADAGALATGYEITFLGRGWSGLAGQLRGAGYEVSEIGFATDYISEVCHHDVQLTPITIGTGTKGKVLDALANGLLVMGTPYAMENIAVRDGMECVTYTAESRVTEVLRDLLLHPARYEAIARAGRDAVLRHHDRGAVSAQFFALFTGKKR